ncbi:MAG TPA: TIGR03943 family protein [Actinomycetota bacterium]|nr:TIGR03943 family protein [Actinomycetota bacterium]
MRTWSPDRLLSAATLASWAGLFWWLLASGRTALYLSGRTSWVVPLGGTILTVAALGRLASARAPRPEPITKRGALASAAVVLPVVVVVALPPTTLGSYAAARRSTLVTAGGFGSSREEIASGDVTLFDIAGAFRSGEAMRALTARAGREVSFTGFVDRSEGMPAEEFLLTRFLVSCCAADALTVQVRVVGAPPGRFEQDDWVRVTGALFPLGDEVIVDASDVSSVARPEHPYLGT